MIVDDETDTLTAIKKELENQGLTIIGFSDPLAAVKYFEKNEGKIDLVITDARMQKMSGFQIARRVKELRPDVKVILISGFEINKNEFDKVMPHTPIDGFLTKPFHISKLIQVVGAIV